MNDPAPRAQPTIATARLHLAPLVADPRWTRMKPPAATPLWTDDFSNILTTVKLLKGGQ